MPSPFATIWLTLSALPGGWAIRLRWALRWPVWRRRAKPAGGRCGSGWCIVIPATAICYGSFADALLVTAWIETLLVGVEGDTQRVRVPAHSTVSLGFDGAEPLLFTGLSAKPGTDVRTTFQSGTGEAVEDRVPVLDGTLSYLKDFIPAS